MAFTAQQSVTLNSGTTPALSSTTPATVTFGNNANNTPIRYAYIEVENGTAFDIFVRADGSAATNAGGDQDTLVPAGASVTISNGFGWWTQAASVIPPSAAGAGAYTNASGNGPLGVTPMGTSPYGGSANPGTSISVVAVSGSTPTATSDVTITGTG